MLDIALHGTRRELIAKISALERITDPEVEIVNPSGFVPDAKHPGKYFFHAKLASPEERMHRPRSKIREVP